MGNNKEIRQKIETYRSILLVFNWIVAVVIIIVGFVLANSLHIKGIGIGVFIGSIVIGMIGHFLINVTLAIPFILLNNGDILESMKGNVEKPLTSKYAHDVMKTCPFCAEEIKSEAKICPHCGKNIQEYEIDLKNKQEEDKKRQAKEIQEKYKNNSDILSDEDIMNMSIEEKDKYVKKFKAQFEETTDETEKKNLAKNLTALGYGYYRKFT